MTKLKKQGMPVDSVESARAWRTDRQNIAARKPDPAAAATMRRPMYEQPALVPTSNTTAAMTPAAAPASQPGAADTPALSAAEIYKAAMESKARYEAAYGVGGGPSDGALGMEPTETHDLARTRREISEANQAEMREHEQRGDLLRVSAIKSTLAAAFATARDALLQIPARLAPLLAADQDPASVQTMLHTEIHQALQHLSGASDRLGQTEAAP